MKVKQKNGVMKTKHKNAKNGHKNRQLQKHIKIQKQIATEIQKQTAKEAHNNTEVCRRTKH